jgi:hypothetical protein
LNPGIPIFCKVVFTAMTEASQAPHRSMRREEIPGEEVQCVFADGIALRTLSPLIGVFEPENNIWHDIQAD